MCTESGHPVTCGCCGRPASAPAAVLPLPVPGAAALVPGAGPTPGAIFRPPGTSAQPPSFFRPGAVQNLKTGPGGGAWVSRSAAAAEHSFAATERGGPGLGSVGKPADGLAPQEVAAPSGFPAAGGGHAAPPGEARLGLDGGHGGFGGAASRAGAERRGDWGASAVSAGVSSGLVEAPAADTRGALGTGSGAGTTGSGFEDASGADFFTSYSDVVAPVPAAGGWYGPSIPHWGGSGADDARGQPGGLSPPLVASGIANQRPTFASLSGGPSSSGVSAAGWGASPGAWPGASGGMSHHPTHNPVYPGSEASELVELAL